MHYQGEQETIGETVLKKYKEQVENFNTVMVLRDGVMNDELKETWKKLQIIKKHLVNKGLLDEE